MARKNAGLGRRRQRRSAGKAVRQRAKRVRLSPTERSDFILTGAVRFFAERGFGGQTRELAQQLGISKGLLFRYFPSKEALIDRIYEKLFEERWKPEWDVILGDRSRPLQERLVEFYLDYSTMLHDYEWGRIYLYSGLGGSTIAQRFVKMVTERVYIRVLDELRHEFRQPDLAARPVSEPELEMMWALHGSIFYIGIRKWIYHVAPPRDIPGTVTQMVERFYANARDLMSAESRTAGR